MVPTHSGATAPVRAQGPARYSVLEQGLQQQAPKRKLVTWGGGVRRGGETGGPNSPGTRELGRVGCEWQGRITSRGLDPSGRSYPHSSRTLPSGSLQSLARPPHPGPQGQNSLKGWVAKVPTWGGREVCQAPGG